MYVELFLCFRSWPPPLDPVPIAIFSLAILFTRVGLPGNLFLTGSLTAALRFSKGWVRKDLNLVMEIGCTRSLFFNHVNINHK